MPVTGVRIPYGVFTIDIDTYLSGAARYERPPKTAADRRVQRRPRRLHYRLPQNR